MLVGLGLIKLVASTGEQSLSIFVFAALPVTLLTLLSKSDLGKVQGHGGPPLNFTARALLRHIINSCVSDLASLL